MRTRRFLCWFWGHSPKPKVLCFLFLISTEIRVVMKFCRFYTFGLPFIKYFEMVSKFDIIPFKEWFPELRIWRMNLIQFVISLKLWHNHSTSHYLWLERNTRVTFYSLNHILAQFLIHRIWYPYLLCFYVYCQLFRAHPHFLVST